MREQADKIDKLEQDNHYLEKMETLKKARVDEQYYELKRIIPEQGIWKRRLERIWNDEIMIRDRRHRSMSSTYLAVFPFTNAGVEVARFYVLKKEVFLADSSLFDLVKQFAEKWGYKKIRTEYQI